MKFLLLTCLIFFTFNEELVRATDAYTEGYYWRDYLGSIPSDALVGGKDNQGNPIYIGQTIYPQVGVVVPGKICATTKKLYFEFDRTEHPITDDVKILCSAHPGHFKWIPTNSDANVASVLHGNRQLIVGGHDRPHLVTIGRRNGGDGVNVGKVLVINNAFEAIHLTKDGNGWQESSFEVLVYTPSESSGVSTHSGGSSSAQSDCKCDVKVTVN